MSKRPPAAFQIAPVCSCARSCAREKRKICKCWSEWQDLNRDPLVPCGSQGNRCSIRLSYGIFNDFNSLEKHRGFLSLFYLLFVRAAIASPRSKPIASASSINSTTSMRRCCPVSMLVM